MTTLLPDLRERLRSLDVDHSSWPTRLTIRLSTTEAAVITTVFPVSILPSVSCEACVNLPRLGLLVRVPIADLPFLRSDRVALTCSACGARYVRPNGAC